jgi:DNA processing protein
VSGLALGIDAVAHEGALVAGGRTTAVLANGLDSIYPRSHERLAKEILAKNGAIISEYAPGTPAYPNQFLERNRIISGLSIATIIIEAPIRSGALVTARHAIEQGREVFIAPGPSLHQNYRGSHLLIRNGARLISSTDDILEDLQDIITNYRLPISNISDKIDRVTDEHDRLILKTLEERGGGLNVDKIIELTKLEARTVNQHLTFLLFEGLIKEHNGHYELSNR